MNFVTEDCILDGIEKYREPQIRTFSKNSRQQTCMSQEFLLIIRNAATEGGLLLDK